MIPAALHSGASGSALGTRIPSRAVLGHSVRLQSRNINQRDATPVDGPNPKFVARQNISPRQVNASDTESVDVSYPKSMLLVIQTEEVDNYGRVWSISVVRLTVFHPVVRQVQKGTIPKTT